MPKKRSREILERFLTFVWISSYSFSEGSAQYHWWVRNWAFIFLETLKRNVIGSPISKSDQEPLNANEPLPLLVNTQFFYNPFK